MLALLAPLCAHQGDAHTFQVCSGHMFTSALKHNSTVSSDSASLRHAAVSFYDKAKHYICVRLCVYPDVSKWV